MGVRVWSVGVRVGTASIFRQQHVGSWGAKALIWKATGSGGHRRFEDVKSHSFVTVSRQKLNDIRQDDRDRWGHNSLLYEMTLVKVKVKVTIEGHKGQFWAKISA